MPSSGSTTSRMASSTSSSAARSAVGAGGSGNESTPRPTSSVIVSPPVLARRPIHQLGQVDPQRKRLVRLEYAGDRRRFLVAEVTGQVVGRQRQRIVQIDHPIVGYPSL